jgi:hypothetical protein
LALAPIATYRTGGPSAVQAAIGTPTFSGRCAVCDGTNTVIDHIIADPALYTDRRGAVRASDKTMLGDWWNGSGFQRRFAEVSYVNGQITRLVATSITTPPVPITSGNYIASLTYNTTAQVSQVILPTSKIGIKSG